MNLTDTHVRRLVRIGLEAWDLSMEAEDEEVRDTTADWADDTRDILHSISFDVERRCELGKFAGMMVDGLPGDVLSIMCSPEKIASPESMHRLFRVVKTRRVTYGEASAIIVGCLRSHSDTWDLSDYSLLYFNERDIDTMARRADRDVSMLKRQPDGSVLYSDLISWLTWTGTDSLFSRCATSLGYGVVRATGSPLHQTYLKELERLREKNERGGLARDASRNWQSRIRASTIPADAIAMQRGRLPENELIWMAKCAAIRELLTWYWNQYHNPITDTQEKHNGTRL